MTELSIKKMEVSKDICADIKSLTDLSDVEKAKISEMCKADLGLNGHTSIIVGKDINGNDVSVKLLPGEKNKKVSYINDKGEEVNLEVVVSTGSDRIAVQVE